MNRRHSATILILLTALWPMLPVMADETALPPSVQRILEGHGLGKAGLSIVIRPVDAEQPLLALNPETPRSPASTIKLLTTFAALDLLGPAYSWRTEAWITGDLSEGRLEGDLILKGGGDPYLTTERFWTFLRDLNARGLRHIDGNLVIDNSYFDPEPEDPGAFDGQPWRTYNVSPDALLVNLKAVQFRVYRPAGGGRPQVITDPVLANLKIDNRIGTAKGPCRGFQRGVAIDLPEGLGGNAVQLSGRFPAGCREYSLYRTVMTPPQFAYGVFKPLWQQLGGSLSGDVRIGVVPDDAQRLSRFDSVPLAEVVRNVNKFSNNVMTRQLLLTMGAEKESEPGTAAKGREVINRWLADLCNENPGRHAGVGRGGRHRHLGRDRRVHAPAHHRMRWRHDRAATRRLLAARREP